MKYNSCPAGLFLLPVAAVLLAPVCHAGITGEFLLFPHAGVISHPGLARDSALADADYEFGVDTFATVEQGDFRFLGEAMLGRREQEVERLQLGVTAGGNQIWLGRFHNPIGYWNTQFHHGPYLETSVSRPAIENYEESGLLPMHLTGLLFEGSIERNGHGWGYALAAGAGPGFTDELEPLDILDPGAGLHDISLTLNLHYEPMPYAPTRFGVFVNYSEIPTAAEALRNVRQITAGVYGNWESSPWRLLGSVFLIRNELEHLAGDENDEFFSGYIQAEYKLTEPWTLFGRLEWTLGDEADVYLRLFPRHVKDRLLGGIRLDLLKRHALKLEISGNRSQSDDFGQIILQWDAMF